MIKKTLAVYAGEIKGREDIVNEEEMMEKATEAIESHMFTSLKDCKSWRETDDKIKEFSVTVSIEEIK